ncbi:MAG: tRNA pseudouridine(55) synthase TruB [Syntrophomonas sp.]|nr:tRNA pseudouridine(55) synthase TruB [Syntrophomonas sp.]
MDGFLNVNKSSGMTSFDVIRRLKKIIPRHKLGHLGTLDPMAEGVLPVAVGSATRLIEYVTDTDKVYRASMTLGGVSDTQDAWGAIQHLPEIHFEPDRLASLLTKYTGAILQIPPMYSAVHHQGERLYELARQGLTVERAARPITVHSIIILGIAQDEAGRPVVKIEVACSQGTYIRTLCHDIGAELGTGAYMSALVRIQAGVFNMEQAVALDELDSHRDRLSDWLHPVDYPLQHLHVVTLDEAALARVRNGNQVSIESVGAPGISRIYGVGGDLVAIAQVEQSQDGQWLQPLKVLSR